MKRIWCIFTSMLMKAERWNYLSSKALNDPIKGFAMSLSSKPYIKLLFKKKKKEKWMIAKCHNATKSLYALKCFVENIVVFIYQTKKHSHHCIHPKMVTFSSKPSWYFFYHIFIQTKFVSQECYNIKKILNVLANNIVVQIIFYLS